MSSVEKASIDRTPPHGEGFYKLSTKWALVAVAISGVALTVFSAAGVLEMMAISQTGCWALAGVGGSLLLVGSLGLIMRGCCTRVKPSASKRLSIQEEAMLEKILVDLKDSWKVVKGKPGIVAAKISDPDQEFKQIQKWESSKKSVNPKDRYSNVVPHEENRFKLPSGGYINASLLPTGHILTQGPLPNTVKDFWEMVWESETTGILMVTDFKEKKVEKCTIYHPDLHIKSLTCGDIETTCQETKPGYGYHPLMERKFLLKKGEEERIVRHYFLHSWEDQSVISLDTIDKLVEILEENPKAIIHCSAGIGRSGVVEVCYLLKQLHKLAQKKKVSWEIDLKSVVDYLRKPPNGRPGIVKTKSQYKLLYDYVGHLNFQQRTRSF